MGYLAFDRDAVRLLGLSLQRALAELARTRITDERAAMERGQVAAAERAVAGWCERLRDISMCATMEERRAVLTGSGDLDRALWSQIAFATRMELAVDPLDFAVGDVHIDPYLRGAALAAVLRDSDPALLTNAEIARVDRQLALLTATAAGRWGFIDRLGDDGLVDLCEHLGARQARLDLRSWPTPDATAVASATAISGLLATIGTAAAKRRDEGGSIDLGRVTGAVSPAVAAQLIAGMSLVAAELASLTRSVLARWWETSSASDNALLVTTRAPGDVLLPLVAADRIASRSLVRDIDGRWELILRTSRDKWPAEAIILHGTDPADVLPDAAGLIVPRLLDHLRFDHVNMGGFDDPPGYSRAWLGSLAGGWLPELASRPEEWGWTKTEAEAALAFAIDDEGALTVMSGGLAERLAVVAADMPSDRAGARAALAEVSEIAGRMNAIVELERVDDAEAARAFSDMMWSVADVMAVAALGVVGVPAGVVAVAASQAVEGGTSTGLIGMRGYAEQEGWLPPDPEGATFRRDLGRDRDDLAALQAATVMTATFGALVAAERVPPGTPPPPAPTPVDDRSDGGTSEQYLDACDAWQDDLLGAGHIDEELAGDLTGVLHTMLNPGQAAQLGVSVRTGP